MTGLLATWARAHPVDDPGWREELEHADLAVRLWHERLWRILSWVVNELAGIGVEVAAIKGITCEARWYGRLGERPSGDLDILVAPHDRHRVADILSALDSGHPLRSQVDGLVRRRKLEALAVNVQGVSVDLHFDALQLGIPCRQAELLWARTIPLPLPDGGSVRVLDAETTLVELLLNLNRDRFRQLLAFVDIARILGSEHLDWRFIEHFLRAEGLERPALLSLRAVRDELGMDHADTYAFQDWRARLWSVLWPSSVRLQGQDREASFRHRQHLLPALARHRMREGVQLWWRLLFPPRVLVEYAYPYERGPYLWRVTGRRLRHAVRRRLKVLPARADPSARREPDVDTTGPALVPVSTPGVVTMELDGGVLLLDQATGAQCRLDDLAALIWPCFDGSGTLDEIAADVSQAFGVSADQVGRDVTRLVVQLQQLGMLEKDEMTPGVRRYDSNA
jgi:hypothetical protein